MHAMIGIGMTFFSWRTLLILKHFWTNHHSPRSVSGICITGQCGSSRCVVQTQFTGRNHQKQVAFFPALRSSSRTTASSMKVLYRTTLGKKIYKFFLLFFRISFFWDCPPSPITSRQKKQGIAYMAVIA
jgi:hypothetical protein